MDLKIIVKPVKEEFENLFCTTFSAAENAKFLSHIQVLTVKITVVVIQLSLDCFARDHYINKVNFYQSKPYAC